MRHTLTLFLLILIAALVSTAQTPALYDFGFQRWPDVPVYQDNNQLSLPWTGGLNSVKFSEIDLDGDSLNDLFAFEKHGNRILTFLNNGTGYTFAPEYARLFPDLHDWALLKDFNNDGKPDIFTYGLAGIRVFENTSAPGLQFNLVADPLKAFYYNGYVNLYASPDDYPVVEDIDMDGRMDILNFYVLGRYVHYLKNYSQNGYFDLRLEDECWGKFSEAADNNQITLFSDCNDKHTGPGPERHTGSSLLLHDFDNNGLEDLLVGDVDSPHLILLYNNGTQQTAMMTLQDTTFPSNCPIDLLSMPAASLIHLPGQTQPALIVSPSDPSLTKSRDLNSVWIYLFNHQLNEFTLSQTDFLQGDMIDVGSGCYPVMYDFDLDGLLDLFIGNYGQFDSTTTTNGFINSHFSSSISYYKNTGTTNQPKFTLQTTDFGNLRQLNLKSLYPTFGDFDGDGTVDMLCGQNDGTLLMVPNNRLINNIGEIIYNFSDIDVGECSTPQFFDLDLDGKNDLIIGNRRGLFSYFKNTGSAVPVFQKITDTLGGIDLRDSNVSYFGYSVPCLFRSQHHGTVFFCGNEQGDVSLYKNIDNNIDGTFELADKNLVETIAQTPYHFKEGRRIGVAVAELNGDQFPDIIIGNYAGGAALFKGCQPPEHVGIQNPIRSQYRLYPTPNDGCFSVSGKETINSVEIFDILGKKIHTEHNINSSSVNINLKNANNGVYFIRINGSTTIKTVISK